MGRHKKSPAGIPPAHKHKNGLAAEKCLSTLKRLRQLKEHELKLVLQQLPEDSINELCTVVYNFMYGRLPGPENRRHKLSSAIAKSHGEYSTIADRNVDVKKRRKLLVKQSGQGLGTLLAIGIPLIANLIKNLTSKKK